MLSVYRIHRKETIYNIHTLLVNKNNKNAQHNETPDLTVNTIPAISILFQFSRHCWGIDISTRMQGIH